MLAKLITREADITRTRDRQVDVAAIDTIKLEEGARVAVGACASKCRVGCVEIGKPSFGLGLVIYVVRDELSEPLRRHPRYAVGASLLVQRFESGTGQDMPAEFMKECIAEYSKPPKYGRLPWVNRLKCVRDASTTSEMEACEKK